MRFVASLSCALHLFWLVAFQAGCRGPEASDLTESVTAEVAPVPSVNLVFLVSQGFYSCTYALHDAKARLTRFVDDAVAADPALAQAKIRTAFIEACFTGGIIEDGGGERLLVTITEPDYEQTSRAEFRPGGVGEAVQAVAERMGQPGNPARVILIGHSHGGWLAMRIASSWRGDSSLRHLITVDPISYVNCTQGSAVMAKAMIATAPLTGFFTTDDCQRPPQDLLPHIGEIRSRVKGSWRHVYQTDFSLLHSGPITGVTQNMHLSVPEVLCAHCALVFDKRVWTMIGHVVRNELTEAAAAG